METGGGILADEMGLGKTLTMLAAMIRTADEARAFALNTYPSIHLDTEHTLIRSRATLVVVPSPCKSRVCSKHAPILIESSTPQRMDARNKAVSVPILQ